MSKVFVLMGLILVLFLGGCLSSKNETIRPEPILDTNGDEPVFISDGNSFSLNASAVKQTLNGQSFTAYAYNQQIPGPLLKVKQGSQVTIHFTNQLPEPTTVHWHGLRLENRFDGVPDVTQKEVLPGESFDYKLDFPDAGLFWYHPHVREDKQQELGLYGTILVEPNETKPSVRKEVIVLDDILLEEKGLPIFLDKETNFSVMGRYGNVYLVNGKTDYQLKIKVGERIQLFLLNASNARPIKFGINNAQIKVIGSDVGFYEKPFFADSITLSPSERAIVEILFEKTGEFSLLNKKPNEEKMGTILVEPGSISTDDKQSFEKIEENRTTKSEVQPLRNYFDREPDFDYELLIRWPVMDRMMERMGHDGGMMGNTGTDDIEWEDEMRPINEITTSEEVTWIIRNAKTKKENMSFYQTVKKGDVKKIRLTNLETSSHPMQHPIHLHGNRFLVVSQDGKRNDNLVWKDTVTVPRGSTVDLLVEFSNPGDWMIHCHNAEHLSSGMMSMIKVEN